MGTSRYFVSYRGIKLPLKLVNEITEASLNNRNTYYRGYFDVQDPRQNAAWPERKLFMVKLNPSINTNITIMVF